MVRHNKPRKLNEDKTVIGDEWSGEDKPDYICSWCQCNLVRLSSGNNSESWFCRRCQIPFEPSETQIRKKSKLGTQREETEPAISSVGGVPDISMKKQIPLRGSFEALSKRGTIRFTSYSTTEKE
jgi:hypothetical protein